jgi:hypothetical protein
MLRRARSEGLTASHALMHDDAFASLRERENADFRRELDQARVLEREARRALVRAGGGSLVIS